MPVAPVERLTFRQITYLKRNKCIHRMPYLIHYSCYLKGKCLESKEKIGFLDIETSNLNANFGFMFSYCIKEENGKIISAIVTKKDLDSSTYDKRILKQFCIDVRKFDRVVTHYGTRFDLPFLRARALRWGLTDFPGVSEIRHTDTYFMAKSKLKISSRRLQTICQFFNIKSKGHPMHLEQWLKANRGVKSALNFIMMHNKEDVVSTEQVYHKLEKFYHKNKTSI